MNIDKQALARVYAAAYVNQRDFSGAQIKLSNGKLYNLYEGIARSAVRDFVNLMHTLQAEENAKAENSDNMPEGYYTKPDFMDQVVYDAYGFPIK